MNSNKLNTKTWKSRCEKMGSRIICDGADRDGTEIKIEIDDRHDFRVD